MEIWEPKPPGAPWATPGLLRDSFILPISFLTPTYRVIHKSVKHFKNSQQIDYATDHRNSYVDREKNCLSFFKEKPAHIVALIYC